MTKSKTKSATQAPTSEGRKPASKIKEAYEEYGFAEKPSDFGEGRSMLDLDPELKAELKEKGFEARWINYKQYKNAGFHKRDWKPYRRESQPKGTVLHNVDAEGYTFRQDLILAVKPISYVEAHRAHLRKKALYQADASALKRKEFTEYSRNTGLKTDILGDDD